MNTPKPGHPAEDFPTRATRALTEAAELPGKPEHVLQPVMARAAHLVMAVISGGGDGQHEIHFSLSRPDGDLEYTLPYSAAGRIIAFPDDGGEQMLVMLLSIASLSEYPGIMTLRSRLHTAGVGPGELTIRGWRLGGHSPQPMTDSELFAFASTSRGGAPAVPEPGTRLRAAFHLDHGPHPTRPYAAVALPPSWRESDRAQFPTTEPEGSVDVPNHANSSTAPDPDSPGVLHRAAALIETHRHEPAVGAIGNPSIARDLRSLARQLQARLPEPDAVRSVELFAELDRLAATAPQDAAELPALSPELFLAGARYLVAYMDRRGVYAREIPVDAAHLRSADLIEIAKNYSPTRLIDQYGEARRTEAELAVSMAPPDI